MNALLKTSLLLFLGLEIVLCEVTIVKPDESDLERPSSNNLYPVRDWFKRRNYCERIANRQDPTEPLRLSAETFELPAANATVVDSDMIITGLYKGVIVDVYYNKLTGVAVLTIDFHNIHYKETATFSFHRKGQEDIKVAIPDTTEYYKYLTTTSQTAGLPKFRSWNTNTHIHVNVPAQYNFPGAEDIIDPEVNVHLGAIKENEFAVIEELYLRRGPILATFYINNVICNPKYNPTE